MALSFYSNCLNNHAAVNSLFPRLSPEMELFSFYEDSTLYDIGNGTEVGPGINPIFDLNCSSYSDIVTPAGNVFTPSPEFQASSFTDQDPYYNLPCSSILNCQEQLLPELPLELPPLPEPLTYQGGGGALFAWNGSGGADSNGEVEEKKVNAGGGSLSAQSKAARVRRRRISEKTQELGKLIPGGHKMNTAEMFQAAFKYIKFLQAQIGVLKLMASLPGSEEMLSNGEMQALVTCTLMQERLYTAEKCIGPKCFAENVANHH